MEVLGVKFPGEKVVAGKTLKLNGVAYRNQIGKPYLEITTTLPALHRLCVPDCTYGGANQARIERHLDELANTPVVFQTGQGNRASYPFLESWKRDGRKVIVRIHWRWSQAFADQTKRSLKPFLLGELNRITSRFNHFFTLNQTQTAFLAALLGV